MSAVDWVKFASIVAIGSTAICCAYFSRKQQRVPDALDAAIEAARDGKHWRGSRFVRPGKAKGEKS